MFWKWDYVPVNANTDDLMVVSDRQCADRLCCEQQLSCCELVRAWFLLPESFDRSEVMQSITSMAMNGCIRMLQALDDTVITTVAQPAIKSIQTTVQGKTLASCIATSSSGSSATTSTSNLPSSGGTSSVSAAGRRLMQA